MDLFTIVKSVGELVYHGTSKPIMQLVNRPTWFAHSEKDATRYGEIVKRFKYTKEVRLIDISNQIFHMDFIAKVNNEKAPNLDTSKYEALVPLGLPTLESQLEMIGHQKDGVYPGGAHSEKDMLNIIDVFSPLFGNKHRYSTQIGNTFTDNAMIEALTRHYPKCDGYICMNPWPSYHHGGFLAAETCLFAPDTMVTEVKNAGGSKSKKNKVQTGGGIYGPYISLDDFITKHKIDYFDVIKVNPLIGAD